ncbi:MAG: hypothetical protein P8O16_14120 [Algoriphagus sp.]|uniref:hypothetical protein n=1 Tax=Algoriphagus sp. TaxID=1872435 RepID=UPI00260BACD1|nr:hypothetical protein [Algoriphagus sp.]MDG1278415.1 hypothetical protein [Algoriphagus sp.]
MDPRKIQQIIDAGVDFDIQEILQKAWVLFKTRASFHIGFMFIIGATQAFFAYYLEDFVSIYSILLAPALIAGFYLVANRLSQEEYVDFQNYFDGFKYWLLVVTINLISGILTVLGIFALIVPGIYLAVGYMFAMLFGIFGGFDFWTSMEMSRKLVTTNWWKFFGFVLILLLLNIAGLLAFIVGILITVPVTYLAIYVLFEQLTEDAVDESPEGEKTITHL